MNWDRRILRRNALIGVLAVLFRVLDGTASGGTRVCMSGVTHPCPSPATLYAFSLPLAVAAVHARMGFGRMGSRRPGRSCQTALLQAGARVG